ncbi:MAG: B12-binding domain-containing radical SAM protein, partial [Methanomassiliicoccales archaeon]|nr:B12-binding domain-containing radical SAM protein [Methanomassiliicoccales archaeon]
QSLLSFPEIDYIVRGEGERTLTELVQALRGQRDTMSVNGLSFLRNAKLVRTPPRELIEDLDTLPFPAYHLVEGNLKKYHFAMMAGKTRYLIMEGSRGCIHRCSFCTQWKHWNGAWRTKSPQRIAEEMAYLRDDLGGGFIWLTDDNFEYGRRGKQLAEELGKRGFDDSVHWFFQSRTDDIVKHPEVVASLRGVGNDWQLIGVENGSPEVLKNFKKGASVNDAKEAVAILRKNDVFAQAMIVLGSRTDTSKSIGEVREFVNTLDPHMAIFTILTPFPGTEIYESAWQNGWIEDDNFAHYDMAHAIMPTETLTRSEVQRELYDCYKEFFGSPIRAMQGIFSSNEIKKRAFRHLAGKRVLGSLRQLI